MDDLRLTRLGWMLLALAFVVGVLGLGLGLSALADALVPDCIAPAGQVCP